MNLLLDYGSTSETEEPQIVKKINNKELLPINLTPQCDITDLVSKDEQIKQEQLAKLYTTEVKNNHLTGDTDSYFVNNFNFDDQFYTFQRYGRAQDPSTELGGRLVFNKNIHPELNKRVEQGELITEQQMVGYNQSALIMNKNDKQITFQLKQKRKRDWDPTSGDYQGPWATIEELDQVLDQNNLTEEQKEQLAKLEEKRKNKIIEKQEKQTFEASSIFHGKDLHDYQGRSYLVPSSDLKPIEHTCYIPKKQVHTWTGHNKGVQVVRFFPTYGHFILSGSLDSKVKLWSTTNDRKCIRTYLGHKEAVRDLCFTNDGYNFLSAGYDKIIHYWDTEVGKVISTFSLKKYPFCVRFNPDQDKQKLFLAASSSKRIYQYDLRSGSKTLDYDEHLSAVNSVTFIDNNRKFVSTSDDKKIFVWEFGLPVVVKHIAEPDMHAVTQTCMSPNQRILAGQASNNQIVIYDAKGGNFKLNRKKKFGGHQGSGYAITPTFSADNQFLASGDADGKVYVWDWKSTKNLRTFKAHDDICMGVAWHPIEPSKMVSWGWDNVIKYWD